ncbi:hypothetical protein LIER_00958 [Lithospermum erythrorhizon]|uniref:Uncharacterized protein n=1 Tax=Lithospermum erythrorhizon TaxID=34254 RepID=A0AAV3NP15_LITER
MIDEETRHRAMRAVLSYATGFSYVSVLKNEKLTVIGEKEHIDVDAIVNILKTEAKFDKVDIISDGKRSVIIRNSFNKFLCYQPNKRIKNIFIKNHWFWEK